ncbi:MAG TPA: hypothetical protein VF509_02220 [Sphingobium sp.]
MFRFASLSLFTAILMAVFGFSTLAGDFAWIALGLFMVAMMSSCFFAGMGALDARDARRCYN